MQRVFVSYRRDDTAREAHVLKALLEERLADVAVFIDTEDIPGGAEWPSTLRMELERAGAVIALDRPGLETSARERAIGSTTPQTGSARSSSWH